MNITTDFFELLRSRINVSDVVRKKVALKKRGLEYTGLCPFHSEKSPSFTVNDIKRFYHCFGCQAHGDVIRFTSEIFGLGYKASAIKLAQEYGIEIPKLSKAEERMYEEVDQIHHVLQLAMEFFQKNLTNDAKLYLQSRHFKQSTIQDHKIGYASSGDTLRKYLEQQKIPLVMMHKAGLVGKGEDGSIYEIFRDRIIFPIRSLYGKVVGFGGRTMRGSMPKYLNSPETIVFKKNEIVYGEDKAMGMAYKTGRIIVVEGYMDQIAMYSHGIENTVASLGTAVTNNHLTKLWHSTDEIIMCLDGDAAGIRASKKVIEQSIARVNTEKSVSFVLMPHGQDPDDILAKHGKSYMEGLLNSRLSLAEMIWHLETDGQTFTTPEQRASLEQRLQNHANSVADTALRRNYLRFFKDISWQFFRKKTKSKISTTPSIPTTMSEMELIEHGIVSILIKLPQLLYEGNLEEDVGSLSLQHEILSDIRGWLLNQASTNAKLDAAMLSDLAKNTSFTEVFMLVSSPNFIFLDKQLKEERYARILLSILIKKHSLIKTKAEYAVLAVSQSDGAFDRARKYQQEILKLQQEIDVISDNLTQQDKYE